MSDIETLPAPVIKPRRGLDINWNPERANFYKMFDQLIAEYENKYVAIHQGKVVAHGIDEIAVASEAIQKFGNVPIYIHLVSRQPVVPIKISAARAK